MSEPLAPLETITSHGSSAPHGSIQYPTDQNQAVLSSKSSLHILTFEQFKAGYSQTPRIRDGFEGIEILYRNNVLWARTALYKHCVSSGIQQDYANPSVIESVRKDIRSYTRAVEDFRAFRTTSKIMFKDDQALMQVGDYLSYLATKKRELDASSPSSSSTHEELDLARQSLSQYYATSILPDHEAGVGQELARNAQRGLYARLGMALGGGLALIVPMLIMVLDPTQVKSLVVTCVFVIAVAVVLAVCMETAEPKDIIASVAGYAAVLVVFVGLNVPTSSA